jgi:hypothetical protein
MCACVCVYVYVCVCMYIYIYIYVCVCVCVCVCMYVCMYPRTINTDVTLPQHTDVTTYTRCSIVPLCLAHDISVHRDSLTSKGQNVQFFIPHLHPFKSVLQYQKRRNLTAPLRKTTNSIHSRNYGTTSSPKSHLIVSSCKVWRSCGSGTTREASVLAMALNICDRYMFRRYDKQQRAPACFRLSVRTIQSPQFSRTAHQPPHTVDERKTNSVF